MITFEEFKKEAEEFGISLSQWDYVREEYENAIQEAKEAHRKMSHLREEWKKIDEYYSKLCWDEFEGLYDECVHASI